jgi:hypothetical protein
MFFERKVMKKLIGNSNVCVGRFKGPDIEEGTFHEDEAATNINHKSGTQQCPCDSIESNEADASGDSNKNTEKDTASND